MRYEVRILRSAEKEMDKLPSAIHTRISRKILSLEESLAKSAVEVDFLTVG